MRSLSSVEEPLGKHASSGEVELSLWWKLQRIDIGKRIDGFEYQAGVLKNEAKEIKLSVLKLKDGKAQTIAEGL